MNAITWDTEMLWLHFQRCSMTGSSKEQLKWLKLVLKVVLFVSEFYKYRVSLWRNEMKWEWDWKLTFRLLHIYTKIFSFLKFKRQDIINSELRNAICSKYFVPFLKGPLNEFGEGVSSVYFHFCHEHVCSFSFEIEVIRPDFFLLYMNSFSRWIIFRFSSNPRSSYFSSWFVHMNGMI